MHLMMKYIFITCILLFTNLNIVRTSDRGCKRLNGHCLFNSTCEGRFVSGKCCGPPGRQCCIQRSQRSAAYLDLCLEMDSEGHLKTKLNDQRDDCDLSFPLVCGYVPAAPAYGVCISQLIRYSRPCDGYNDFCVRGKLLTFKLLEQARPFVLYKCPLSISTALFGKCTSSSSNETEGIRNPIPQGIAHTYVELSKSMTCYDWGDWNYIRNQACTDTSIKCCRADSSVVQTGNTSCTFEGIKAFNVKWKQDHGNYNFICKNCQKYTEDFVEFLKSC